MIDYQTIIDRYYPAGSRRRDIYMRHCRAVATLALELNSRLTTPLDPDEVEVAAMLHDIGIVMTDAPGLDCHGSLPYIAHGAAGADMLRREACPEETARVAERHTGTGLSPQEITDQQLPLPEGRDYMPRTLLERLITYADKFYSKSGDMKRKSFEAARASMSRHGAESLARFDDLAREFGRPV